MDPVNEKTPDVQRVQVKRVEPPPAVRRIDVPSATPAAIATALAIAPETYVVAAIATLSAMLVAGGARRLP